MFVRSVAVLDVRNLADAEIELGPGVNLIWGANGAGKTNVLESVYMALAGRSCRTNDDRETIRFGQGLARAEATVAGGGQERIFLFSISRADGRRHLLDGAPAEAAASTQRPPLAVFMPDRLALVKGAPSLRRSHFDGFTAALWPARGTERRRYSQALAQRNALLGRIRAGTAGPASLDAWDTELASAGVGLIAIRAEAIGRLAEPFTSAASELGLAGEAGLRYRPRSGADDTETLLAELAERRDGDIARGYSGWGPHLDEIALESDGRSLRRYGSQGQQRLALLAVLFAEREVLVEEGRPAPLMVLDDVTSELDADRRGLLLERLLAGGGQALITATERDQIPSTAERTEIRMRDGRALAPAANDDGIAA